VKKIKGMEVVVLENEKRRILESVGHICDTGYFMWGDYQEAFQEKFKTLTGKKFVVTFNSCTAALEVLFRYLGSSNTVCFQANTFPSPAYAALRAGNSLAWSDIDAQDMTPSLWDLEAAYQVSPFQVVVLQWTGGFVPSYVLALQDWCRDKGVHMVEDASHAAGSTMNGRKAGSFGQTSVFSLAATKPLQTGQGGILATDDQRLAEYCFQMKNYGRTEMFQRGEYMLRGHNMHLTEIQAAIGLVMFESMENRIRGRYKVLEQYVKHIENAFLPSPVCFLGSWSGKPNLYKLVLKVPSEKKAKLKKQLAEANVELGSSIYDFVTPHLPVFGKEYGMDRFPRTAEFAQGHVCLPMHDGLLEDEADYVGRKVVEFLYDESD